MSDKSYGEKIVRTDFNVTGSDMVNQIKTKTAELINLISSLNVDPRLTSLAITSYEEAAMWAVKSATATEPVSRGTLVPL
jgi:hypothetical protein